MALIGHNGPPPEEDALDRDGWVAVARAMRDHWLVGFGRSVTPMDEDRDAFSRAEAWLDLIMECRYSEGTVNNNGRKMRLEPGQLLGATSWLANRWNWTPKTVRGFLDKLEDEGMIERFAPGSDECQVETKPGKHKGKLSTVLTISKYSLYQLAHRQQGQVSGQVAGELRASCGQVEGNIYKEETREQGNKGTLPQGPPEPHPGPSPDDLARQAYLDGERVKQGVATKSARSQNRSVGELDGSKGIAFSNGKLSIFNGAAIELGKDFPGIDLRAVCDRAGPEVAKMGYPSATDAMAVLRKWARIVSESKPGGKPKGDPMVHLTADQRARIDAQKVRG